MSIESLSEVRKAYLKKRVMAALDVIPDSLDTLKATYCRGMALIWGKEGDVGPEEVIESMGSDAARLFVEGARLLAFILESDPEWSYPVPTRLFTLNQDGTVSLSPIPDPEPEPTP